MEEMKKGFRKGHFDRLSECLEAAERSKQCIADTRPRDICSEISGQHRQARLALHAAHEGEGGGGGDGGRAVCTTDERLWREKVDEKCVQVLFPPPKEASKDDIIAFFVQHEPEQHAADRQSPTSVPDGVSPPPLLLVLGVVVPGRPARVQLHVQGALSPGHLVVLGLLSSTQRVPLQRRRRERARLITWVVYGLFPLPLLLLEAEPVVVARVPVRVHLHVLLALYPRLLVVLGLLLAR